MIEKAIKHISYVTIIIAILGVIYGAYMVLYTPQLLEVEQPMPVNKKVYRIGDQLTYTIKYCKTNYFEVIAIKRFLVNHYVYELPVESAKWTGFPIGCKTAEVTLPLVVPESINTNEYYHVEVVVDYRLNLLNSGSKIFKTEEFKLLPNKK